MGATKMHEQIQNIGKIKLIKTLFCTTQQATNFKNVQIELVPVITATKRFLSGILHFCVYFIHVLCDALPLPAEVRNTEDIGD